MPSTIRPAASKSRSISRFRSLRCSRVRTGPNRGIAPRAAVALGPSTPTSVPSSAEFPSRRGSASVLFGNCPALPASGAGPAGTASAETDPAAGSGPEFCVSTTEPTGRRGGRGAASATGAGAVGVTTVLLPQPTPLPREQKQGRNSPGEPCANHGSIPGSVAAFSSGADENLSRNSVPLPGHVSNPIVPPCSCTTRNVIASPMPDPCPLVVK